MTSDQSEKPVTRILPYSVLDLKAFLQQAILPVTTAEQSDWYSKVFRPPSSNGDGSSDQFLDVAPASGVVVLAHSLYPIPVRTTDRMLASRRETRLATPTIGLAAVIYQVFHERSFTRTIAIQAAHAYGYPSQEAEKAFASMMILNRLHAIYVDGRVNVPDAEVSDNSRCTFTSFGLHDITVMRTEFEGYAEDFGATFPLVIPPSKWVAPIGR